MRGLGLAVALLLASALATSSREAAAGVCDAACDADCQTCCKIWSLQATCSNGTVAGNVGSFPGPADAASNASSTPSPDPCADKTVPKWVPYCAPENSIPSPTDGPTMGNLVNVRAGVGQSLKNVTDAQSALQAFAEKRAINKGGVARVASSASALRQARSSLTDSLGQINQVRSRGNPSDQDVTNLDNSTKEPRSKGDQAAKDAQALMADPSIIDGPAEQRMARQAALLAAQKAAMEAAAAKAAEQKQKADEAKAAAMAMAGASMQTKADTARTQQLAGLDDTEKRRADLATTLATFQARPEVLPQARSVGDVLTKRLADLQQKIATQRAKVDGTSAAATPDVAMATLGPGAATANALSFEVNRTGADVKALTTSPWNVAKPTAEAAAAPPPAPAPGPAPVPVPVPVPVPAPAPAPVPAPAPAPGPAPPPLVAVAPPGKPVAPTLVPTCEIVFDTHTPGLSIAVDHGQRVPLPARVRVASGRHTLTIQQGTVKSDKRELLLCGHLDTFPVEGP